MLQPSFSLGKFVLQVNNTCNISMALSMMPLMFSLKEVIPIKRQ